MYTASPPNRLPTPIETAAKRLKDAAAAACERTVESLGLASLSSSSVLQRDTLLAAQFELNRKSAQFCLTFGQTLDDRLLREIRPSAPNTPPSQTDWNALSLVDDHELDIQVTAERFGLEIGHRCEWELRELDGYVGPLLATVGQCRKDHDRNPMRPETVGYAVIRAIESVSDRPDIRKVLKSEFVRSLEATMPETYAGLIADLRGAGLKAAGLSVRVTESPSHDFGRPGSHTGAGPVTRGRDGSSGPGPLGQGPSGSRQGGLAAPGGGASSVRGSQAGEPGSARGPGGGPAARGSWRGTPMGRVDAELMALMRRLTITDHGPLTGPSALAADSGAGGLEEVTQDGLRLAAPNVIRAHRDQLRQASAGALDHLVIDVVGSLFDQILSDPKVPPQLARQIGRLQLPVLRTALGDPTFFSSRRHPVRRFINRIAGLASALEDLGDEHGRQFLKLVRELVQGIVDGDFDQAETYENKLGRLEQFVAEQARKEVDQGGDAVAMLAEREGDIRVRQHYARQLHGELQTMSVPQFVRDFLADVWSQVLVTASRREGADSALVQRLRHAGRELFMSVQPKGTTSQRKDFIAQLPRLMQQLNEGMNLIGWPDSAKKTFFGLLLPAHAESLKGEGLRTLEFNLLSKQVGQLFDRPVPTTADLPRMADPESLDDQDILPSFSADEAKRIGLVPEAAVDWDGQVDIDLSAEPPVAEIDLAIEGMPAPEPVEPTKGRSLADHVQIGFAYQMYLDSQWQKVRLNHVSPARTFFVFTHGHRHKQTISLTHRMLTRLCDSGRLRAFESAYLLERATARARRQLAALKPAAVAV